MNGFDDNRAVNDTHQVLIEEAGCKYIVLSLPLSRVAILPGGAYGVLGSTSHANSVTIDLLKCVDPLATVADTDRALRVEKMRRHGKSRIPAIRRRRKRS